MKRLLTVATLLTVMSSPSGAGEDDYTYCSIAGYGFGLGSEFIAGLANSVANKKGVFGKPLCNAAHTSGFEIGQHISRTGRPRNGSDVEVMRQFDDFQQRIQNALLRSAGF